MTDPILIKLGLSVLCTAAAVILLRWKSIGRMSPRQFDALLIALAVTSRAGLFVAAFIVMGMEVRSDVPSYYYPQAVEALKGGLVYRDFYSSYGPLFPYILAGIIWLWDSHLAIVLATICLELLSIPFWIAAARKAFPEQAVRAAAILYVTSVTVINTAAVAGQNQVWLSLHLAVALWLLLLGRSFASGLIMGLTLVSVKLLGVLYAPLLWLGASHRIRWTMGFVLIPLAAYGGLALRGVDVLVPLKFEGDLISPGNLPFLLTLTGWSSAGPMGSVFMMVLAAALVALFLHAMHLGVGRDPRRLFHLITLVSLTFLLLSKKSFTVYQAFAMFTICLMVAEWRLTAPRVLLFGLFGMVSTIEPSIWFRWARQSELLMLWRPDASVPRLNLAAFAVLDAALLAFYVGYWLKAYALIRRTIAPAATPNPPAINPSGA